MHKLLFKQMLPVTIEYAWEFFSSPRNLGMITPERMNFEILSLSEVQPMHAGQIINYKITVLPFIRRLWTTKIVEVIERVTFTDVQLVGPYSHWSHKHTFKKVDGGVEMTDELEYTVPLGLIGRLVNYAFVGREVKSIFDYRRKALENMFGKIK